MTPEEKSKRLEALKRALSDPDEYSFDDVVEASFEAGWEAAAKDAAAEVSDWDRSGRVRSISDLVADLRALKP